MAEKDKGLARSVKNFIYVKVGTGIVAGIIVDGNIYRGSTGAAGDIGHIAIDYSMLLR